MVTMRGTKMRESKWGRLVMTLKRGDVVVIGEDIAITFREYQGGRVKILVNAPKDLNIKRVESESEGNEIQRKSHK